MQQRDKRTWLILRFVAKYCVLCYLDLLQQTGVVFSTVVNKL
jgi:hypothetical protein